MSDNAEVKDVKYSDPPLPMKKGMTYQVVLFNGDYPRMKGDKRRPGTKIHILGVIRHDNVRVVTFWWFNDDKKEVTYEASTVQFLSWKIRISQNMFKRDKKQLAEGSRDW